MARERGVLVIFFSNANSNYCAHDYTLYDAYIYIRFYSSSPDPAHPLDTHTHTHVSTLLCVFYSTKRGGLSRKRRTCHLCRLISMRIHHRRPQVDRHLLPSPRRWERAYSNNKEITAAVGTKEKGIRVLGGTMKERIRGLSRRRRRRRRHRSLRRPS